MQFHALFLTICCVCVGQDASTVTLSGTATNMTNPASPLAAPMTVVFTGDTCRITISPPLVGSGTCVLKALDQEPGKLEIASVGGGASMSWAGMVKGNVASGTYKVEGVATGSFYLAILKQTAAAAAATPPPARRPPATTLGSGCSPAIESTISGEVKGWDGETIFKLDNGQIWQQAAYDYTYFYAYRPEVTIYQTSAGCRMKVEGEEETVVVKRLK